jgi:hypothetical protein
MNVIHALHYVLGLGILVFVVIKGCQEDDAHERNHVARENLRQASDIVSMWARGIELDRAPNLGIDRAEGLLRQALDTKADDEVKREARDLLASIASRGHYFAFAKAFGSFQARLEGDVKLWEKAQGAAPTDGNVPARPGFVVLTMRRPGRASSGPDQLGPFLDPEMIEACGDRVALAPEQVGSIVFLDWRRREVGTYRLSGFTPNGQRVKLPDAHQEMGKAYVHACSAIVVDAASGQVIGAREFAAADPEESIWGSTPSGEHELRKEVKAYLGRLGKAQAGTKGAVAR